MTAFIASAIISFLVFSALVYVLRDHSYVDKWVKMRDSWAALLVAADFYNVPDAKRAEFVRRMDYCDRHIAFWSQPLWARVLWRNYPKEHE